MKRLTRKELAYNSKKGASMANMNTSPTPSMKKMSISGLQTDESTWTPRKRSSGLGKDATWHGAGNSW